MYPVLGEYIQSQKYRLPGIVADENGVRLEYKVSIWFFSPISLHGDLSEAWFLTYRILNVTTNQYYISF